MRKIFTLIVALVAVFGVSAQSVTVTWPTAADALLAPSVTGDGAEYVTASDITLGASLVDPASKANNGFNGMQVSPSPNINSGTKTISEAYWTHFPITVAPGKIFQLKSVALKSAKLGTGDKSYINVFMYLPDEDAKLTIANQIALARNNDAEGYYNDLSYTSFPNFDEHGTDFFGSFEFVVNLYGKMAANKQMWLSNIVIEGEITDAGGVDTRVPAPISWDPASVTIAEDEELASPVFTNPENLSVTFESSNPAVATVDENGVISKAGGIGSAVITAFYSGDETTYKATQATCTIEVKLKSENIIGDKTLKVNLNGDVKAESVILSDDLITVTNPWATTSAAVNANICGNSFTNYVSVRAKVSNGEFTVDGTNSYMVLAPKANMEVIIYGRIQNKTSNPDLNDIKNCAVYDEAMATVNANHMYFGQWTGSNNAYAYVAQTYTLEANKTYYLSAAGFGFQFFGLGYTADIKESGLAYSAATATVELGEPADYPTLSNPNGLEVTYTSSDEAVATVDAEGVVTPLALGETVITASFAGNGSFLAGEASYTLTVVAPAAIADIVAFNVEGVDNKGYVYDGTVEESTVKINGTSVNALKFNNGWTPGATEKSGYVMLTTADGFKSGDVLTLKGVYSNKAEKEAQIEVYANANKTGFFGTTDLFINAYTGEVEVPSYTFVVPFDTEAIYLARKGGTAAYITYICVERDRTLEHPAAPEIASEALEGDMIKVTEGESVEVSFTVEGEAAVYYCFEESAEAETPEEGGEPEVQAAEPTLDVYGMTYTLYTEPITLGKAGTLSYFSMLNGVASEVKSVKVGITTALSELEADAAAKAVYYNLQGVRVDNPAAGLYIRKQGDKVTKVIIK